MNSKRLLVGFISLFCVSGVFAQDGGIDLSDQIYFDHFFLTAQQYKVQGNLSKAFEMLSTCSKLQPKNPTVSFEMSRLMTTTQHYDYAADFADDAVTNDTTGNVYFLEEAIMANLRANRVDPALNHYDALIALETDKDKKVEYYFQKYQVLSTIKKYDECLELLKNVPITSEETNYEVQTRLFETYLSLEKNRKAKKVITALYEKDENNARSNYLMSKYYFAEKDIDKATDYCKKATTLLHGDVYLFTLASIYEGQRMDSLYAQAYRDAFISEDISQETKVQHFGSLLFNSDTKLNTPSWHGFYESLCAIMARKYPEDATMAALRENYFTKIGQKEKGRKVLTDFVSQYPGDDYIWRYLIFNSENTPDSVMLDYCTRAVEDVPDEPIYLLAKGNYLQVEKRYLESLEPLKQAMSLISDVDDQQVKELRTMTLHALATGYFYCDSTSTAFSYFDYLLQDDPTDATALNNYAYYLALKNTRLDEAERMSSQSLNSSPLNPTFLDTYAYILFKRQKYTEALFVMERCIDNSTEPNAEVIEHYGDILWYNGKNDEAIEQWTKALSLDSTNTTLKRKVDEKKYVE